MNRIYFRLTYFALLLMLSLAGFVSCAQTVSKTMLLLPDTGDTIKYTTTYGEDADYTTNPPSYTVNGNGTVIDNVTGLMWQQTDGGEMTIENAAIYCDTLSLGGYNDWRLPTATEAFSILNHQHVNPALNTSVFTATSAEYWWTSQRQANDTTRLWETNAGGGIGSHPKSETISAGGAKHFHTRAVRDRFTVPAVASHFSDLGNGMVRDNLTGLCWQKVSISDSFTWEEALHFAASFSLGGRADWRLPNIKELQSIVDVNHIVPAVDTGFFKNMSGHRYWSSTTLPNMTNKAWYLDADPGLTTYEFKTAHISVLLVRTSTASDGLSSQVAPFVSPIYPNPFVDRLYAQFQSAATTYELRNVTGQLIYGGNNLPGQDFSGLAKGVYFLQIEGETIQRLKLIKE